MFSPVTNHQQPNAVKSRLLPLSPLDAAMERVLEKLPRRLVAAHLVPVNHIAVVDEAKGEYRATGGDPGFELSLDIAAHTGGWFYLEAALVRNNGNRSASLQVEVGGNGAQSFTWPITTNLRGSIREVVHLPPNVTRLRWVPTAAPGFFTQSPLLIHKISGLESVARRLHRVLFFRDRFKHDAPENRAGLTWWGVGTNLQGAYRRTADLRASQARGSDYRAFLARAETRTRSDIRRMQTQAMALAYAPLISIVLPLHQTDPEFFGQTLASVTAQLYPNWELCVAGDTSVSPQVIALIEQRQAVDARIKLSAIVPGLDAAGRFNQAMQLASGEYIAQLGQHDLLPVHALFHIALELGKHPETDLVYTDEDKIDALNARYDPAFKPDWNPDLLLSHNYIASLAVYRRARVARLGGYRSGFDHAEDYDLLLRLLGENESARIRHVPMVLYSRRTLQQTAADSVASRNGDDTAAAHRSGLRALQEHLNPSGATATDGLAACLYRVKHPLPAPLLPLVSLIVPTRDKVDILKACIESVRQKTDYPNWEMLIVDNQSAEPDALAYLGSIQSDSRIRVIQYNKPFNYSAINNFAVQQAKGEILALLNNDVEVISADWLTEMVSHAVRPGVGAVGAKLLYSNGTVQHAGVILGIGGVAGHVHRYLDGDSPGYCNRAVVVQNLSAVTGACLVVRKSIYEAIDGLNEVDLVVALNDVDFCLKLLEAGYRNVFTPYATLYHHESISRGRDDTPGKRDIFANEYKYMKKNWGSHLKLDAAYNPNLTLEFENFSYQITFANAHSI